MRIASRADDQDLNRSVTEQWGASYARKATERMAARLQHLEEQRAIR